MRATFPHGSHIARKRGIYHYRRRLPAPHHGEVTISLSTARYREAEHLATVLDGAFGEAWKQALAAMSEQTDGRDRVAAALNEYLREELKRHLKAEVGPDGVVPLGLWPAKALEIGIAEFKGALAERNYKQLAFAVDRIMALHGLPPSVRDRVGIGVLEAELKVHEEALRRARGEVPLVLFPDIEAPTQSHPQEPAKTAAPVQPAPMVPRFSDLLEAFAEWRKQSGVRGHTLAQDRPTLRFFQEIAGDKAVSEYQRRDVGDFLTTMQRFPASYGRSPADKDRSAAEIIARGEAAKADRVKPKTARRHLTVLSRFFKFCFDRGYISKTQRDDLTSEQEFARPTEATRQQRDMWSPDDLKALFATPVWTGCHPHYRTKPGPEVIRDSKFWLPLLALFQGCRLEEFADLYRRDVGDDGGVAFVRISAEERGLKNQNAERVVPLHPEIIRMGFLDYIRDKAPSPADPLFPDIEPQGPDRKRGPRITRWFVNYRRAVKLYRDGVGLHAFRHTANTRLRDVIADYQQERHVAYLFGHSQGGGEGRERYDKGPGLKAVAATLALLRYPELDLSHLYVTVPPEALETAPEAV